METLPYEVIGIIVQDLDLEDVFHLSLASKRFLYLIQEEWVCKSVLEVLTFLTGSCLVVLTGSTARE